MFAHPDAPCGATACVVFILVKLDSDSSLEALRLTITIIVTVIVSNVHSDCDCINVPMLWGTTTTLYGYHRVGSHCFVFGTGLLLNRSPPEIFTPFHACCKSRHLSHSSDWPSSVTTRDIKPYLNPDTLCNLVQSLW